VLQGKFGYQIACSVHLSRVVIQLIQNHNQIDIGFTVLFASRIRTIEGNALEAFTIDSFQAFLGFL